MTAQEMTIEKASPPSLGEIIEILSAVDLPHKGVELYLNDFLIARSRAGEMLGCVGLERHGELGLLRSAAVLPGYQGRGIGDRLIRRILEHAAGEGVTEVALLTTTAKQYFETRFGFREASRADYQSRLADSPEWNLPRCSSASFMSLRLNPADTRVN
jgi:N-acetylglutamate synthase-like GNAT family acetyltransferase